jgi:hypothetical protein
MPIPQCRNGRSLSPVVHERQVRTCAQCEFGIRTYIKFACNDALVRWSSCSSADSVAYNSRAWCTRHSRQAVCSEATRMRC